MGLILQVTVTVIDEIPITSGMPATTYRRLLLLCHYSRSTSANTLGARGIKC